MNQTLWQVIQQKLIDIINSPHTSLSALFFFALKTAGYIWPARKSLLDEIANAAIMYGFLQAGDARPKSFDTSRFINPNPPPQDPPAPKL